MFKVLIIFEPVVHASVSNLLKNLRVMDLFSRSSFWVRLSMWVYSLSKLVILLTINSIMRYKLQPYLGQDSDIFLMRSWMKLSGCYYQRASQRACLAHSIICTVKGQCCLLIFLSKESKFGHSACWFCISGSIFFLIFIICMYIYILYIYTHICEHMYISK